MRTSSKLGRSPRFRQSIAELEIRAGERERGLDHLRLMRIEKIKNRSRSSAAPAFSEWSSLGQDRIGCIMPEAITGHFLLTPQKYRSSSRLRNLIFHHELNPFSRVTALPRDSFHACHNRTFVGSQDRLPTRVHSGSLPFAQSWRARNLLLESGSMGGRSFLSLSLLGQSLYWDRRTS